LSLAGEINRKENQVKREQRLRHEIEDENGSLRAKMAELKNTNEELIKDQAQLRKDLALVRSLLIRKTDEVAITVTSESYQRQQTTTRATIGKRTSDSALSAPSDESPPKRRITDGLTLANDWHTEGVECKISGHPVMSLWNKICLIKTVTDTKCRVRIKESNQIIVVGCEHLKPVTPQVNEKVKILNGPGVGKTGELISIDDDNIALVRLDVEPVGLELQRPLKMLGKIHQN